LDILLDKYQSQGIKNLEDIKILSLDEFKKIASPKQIIDLFGGKENYLKTIKELENMLYA